MGGLKQGDLLISFGKGRLGQSMHGGVCLFHNQCSDCLSRPLLGRSVHAFNWREPHDRNSVQFPLSVVQAELRRAVLNRSELEFKQGIEVWVLRDDSSQPSLIKIMPDVREGQGHLGCHILPLNIRCNLTTAYSIVSYSLSFILKPYLHLSISSGWMKIAIALKILC